jgi:hypothetical protein
MERGGRGTISFAAALGSYKSEGSAPAFVAIDDAADVHALIRQIRADRNRWSDGAPFESASWAWHWDLPAPEAEVLVHGVKTSERRALELALKELVVRHELRYVCEPTRGLFGLTKRTDVLTRIAGREPIVDRCLAVILQFKALSGTRFDSGGGPSIPIENLTEAVFRHYRKDRKGVPRSERGYVHREVLPALEARGLYARERYRRLGYFDAVRWVLTPAGTARRADLRARLTRGGSGNWGVTGALRARAGFADDSDELDAAFAAIDAGVSRGWGVMFGD